MIQSIEKKKETEAEEGKRRVNIFSRFHVAATRSDGTEESVPLLMELLRREFETRNAYCGVRLSKKKRRYEFRSRTADGGVPLYGAWPPNLNASTATTIRNTGSLDKRRLNRAHRFSFVFESMFLLTTAARVSFSTCSVLTNLDTIVCYVQKNRYGRRWYSMEPTSEHGDLRS